MTSEYKQALESFDQCFDMYGNWVPGSGLFLREKVNTIRKALRLADKLKQEPSEGMLKAAIELEKPYVYVSQSEEFKAMVAQALKELDDDTIRGTTSDGDIK